jgi:hypothetical protein
MKPPSGKRMASPPLIIVGPTTRCGTSLLQRAMNSTRKTVIYGENFTFMHKYPDILSGFDRNIAAKRRNIDTSRKTLLAGEDFEGSSLFPDYDKYANAVREGFYGIVRLYRADAAELGFDRWGLKHQIRDQRSFDVVPKLMGRAQFIFIYRELLAVTRSAKARWPGDFKSAIDYRRFGDNWARNIRTARSLESPRFIILRYEDFVAEPEAHLKKIETFTGIDGIQRSVMDRRINANPLTDRDVRTSGVTYRKPGTLTEKQIELLMTDARATYDELGYELKPEAEETA